MYVEGRMHTADRNVNKNVESVDDSLERELSTFSR